MNSRSMLSALFFISVLLFAIQSTQGAGAIYQCTNNESNETESQNIVCTTNSIPMSRASSNPNVYDETDAFRNLYFAYASYCKVPSLENWDCKWCEKIANFQVKTVINNNSGQAYVGFDPVSNQIVASFRGSHNIEDWLDNINAFLIPYPGVANGEVHKGFYAAWKDVEEEAMQAIKQLMNEHRGANVLVNGHSLGGVLAQLTALSVYDYASQTNNNIKIISYTFGSPRWCNRVIADYYNSRISVNWRITNVRDVVPTVPPDNLGYHHTHTQIWYTSYSPLKYKQCSSVNGEDCDYIGYSPRHHLRYLGVYESCEE